MYTRQRLWSHHSSRRWRAVSREKETRRQRKSRGKCLGTEASTVKASRVLRRCPRRNRQLWGAVCMWCLPGDGLQERRGRAISQRLINKHLLQDKGTAWNRIRPNWGQNVR